MSIFPRVSYKTYDMVVKFENSGAIQTANEKINQKLGIGHFLNVFYNSN